MKQGPFRLWLQNLWMQNKDENADLGLNTMSLDQYFHKYKWWLKREYKFQQKLSK